MAYTHFLTAFEVLISVKSDNIKVLTTISISNYHDCQTRESP